MYSIEKSLTSYYYYHHHLFISTCLKIAREFDTYISNSEPKKEREKVVKKVKRSRKRRGEMNDTLSVVCVCHYARSLSQPNFTHF